MNIKVVLPQYLDVLDQGPGQGCILFSLSCTSSVGYVLSLALLDTEAFDWSS
jgi:hypothetical protein